VPYRKYLEAIRSYTVVDPIPDAIKVKSPYVRRTCFLNSRAYVRLQEQDVQSSLQILADSTWICRSIGSPPLDDTLNLARCAPRDGEFERHD